MNRHYLWLVVVALIALAIGHFGWDASAQQVPYIQPAQITNDKIVDLYPDVSPDGTKVAFMRYEIKEGDYRGNFNIIVQDIKTGSFEYLDTDEADDAFPEWMADGKALLFDSYRQVGKRAIWKKILGGGTIEKVTNISEVALNADCHPNNQQLVFIASDKIKKDVNLRRDGLFFLKRWKKDMPNIYTIYANGSNMSLLNVQGINPKWSPDGKRIVFANNKFGNYEIFTLSVDGSDLLRLTARESQDLEPSWSPDGQFIIFTSNEEKNWNLWVVKADGTGLTKLTSNKGFEGGAKWVYDPDKFGEWFVYFHADWNGNWDIWRLKPTEFRPDPSALAPPDEDGDTIPDETDQCPNEMEDIDGFEDEDGCPDLDNDNDGVLDKQDQCPGQLEDTDGFQDEDGCPDPDNDNDSILDEQDQCPDEPETFNTFNDQDGCPDEPPLKNRTTLKITFKPYRDELTMDSIPILETLVENLKNWPAARVRVKVYTDSRQHRGNRRLTQLRAQQIKKYLITRGISESRIDAIGMGDAEPVATNNNLDGRRQNNRVVIEVITVNP